MSTPPDDYRAPVTTVCVLSGWDLVTGHPLTEEQRRRIAELAKAEGKDVGGKTRATKGGAKP